MGEAAELAVAGIVVALLTRVAVPSRLAALQLAGGVAATVGIGLLVVDQGFRGALAAALAGAAVAVGAGRAWPAATPARGTAAPGRGDTSAPR